MQLNTFKHTYYLVVENDELSVPNQIIVIIFFDFITE